MLPHIVGRSQVSFQNVPTGQKMPRAQYEHCNAAAPRGTPTCILVPAWHKGDFRPLLRDMRLISRYEQGTPLFTSNTAVPCPWQVKVYFDPPSAPAPLSTVHISALSTMPTVLLVSGVSEHFVNQELCKRAGLRTIVAKLPWALQVFWALLKHNAHRIARLNALRKKGVAWFFDSGARAGIPMGQR